jgi:TonB family protein
MTTHALTWLLSYLFNALWQVPLLFAAASIVTRMLRRLGPQVEHRIWVGTLLLQIALPACSLNIISLWRALTHLLPSQGGSEGSGVRILFGPAITAGSTLHLSYALEAAIVCAWAAVVLYFALRLGWGFVQTRNLAHSATFIEAPGAGTWIHHCARFGIAAPPQIASSTHAAAPVAIGLRRGMILLPPNLIDTIGPGDLEAVLAHELAHIVRRDFAKNLLYSLLSLPVTWHPLMWRTRLRVAESRELICDEAAAAAVTGPRRYAESLLRLASAFAGQPRLTAVHAVGILDFSNTRALERRVMTLTRKGTHMRTSRRILLATACSILAIATCTSALALHTDIAAASMAVESKTPTKLHVGPDIMVGQKISGENPTYPKEARAKKIQGTVVLEATIGKGGTVEALHIIKSPDELLSDSAMKAVRTWRYRPYLLNGEPIEVETTISVTYHLGG